MKRVEDPEKIKEFAGKINKLADGFDEAVKLPDMSVCLGRSAEGIKNIADQLRKAREALKSLMHNTGAYLLAKGTAIIEADQQEAENVRR